MRPYHRLQFSEGFDGFKAGLYMNHANHGQFNSTWGRSDFGAPMKWLLNLTPLVTGEEQRKVAKVYIGAFAEVVLKKNKSYLPMFKNMELIHNWLPKETYRIQYADNFKNVLVDFERDLDLSNGLDGIKLNAEHFNIWREIELLARDGGSQQNNALVLGWRHSSDIQSDSIPVYSIELPEALKNFGEMDTLALSLAMGDLSELAINEEGEERNLTPKSGFNFSIMLKDSLGNSASVPLAENNKLPGVVKSKFTKFDFLDRNMIGDESETQLKSCFVPISSFLKQNNSLNMNNLKSIDLVFDKDTMGVVILDDIGFYQKRID
jgi:hypothetical protein